MVARGGIEPPTRGFSVGTLSPWLIYILKDSLWSTDLFRCESNLLKTHWVLVIMNQFTRRIIGFGVHAGAYTWENIAAACSNSRLPLD